MANDPDKYGALTKDWNLGPFFALVDSNTGALVGDGTTGSVVLIRKPGPHFFANAKTSGQVVRVATITLRGAPVDG